MSTGLRPWSYRCSTEVHRVERATIGSVSEESEGDPDMAQSSRSRVNNAWSVSVIALVIVLAALLYVFGAAMSGDTDRLTESVKGADIFDTRNIP